MGALPIELYRRIVEDIPCEDLHPLVTVSRVLQAEAERILWRQVKLSYPTFQTVTSRCRQIIDSPRIWLLVRNFDLAYIDDDYEHGHLAPIFNYLAETLKNLQNLVALMLILDMTDGRWCSCGNLFEGCNFQLRVYCSSFTLDRDHAKFIENQPLILDWNWMPSYPSTCQLSVMAMPSLKVVTYNNRESDFYRIFVGRPIAHINISDVSGPVPPVPPMENLALGAAPIRSLFMWSWNHIARTFCSTFPRLEFLSRVSFYRINENYFISEILPHLQYLRTLEIVPIIPAGSSREGWAVTLLGKVRGACPSLREVGVCDLNTYIYEWNESDQRWELQGMFHPWRYSLW